MTKVYSAGRVNVILCWFKSLLTTVDVLVAVFFATLFRNISSIGGLSSLLHDPKTWNGKKKRDLLITVNLRIRFIPGTPPRVVTGKAGKQYGCAELATFSCAYLFSL